MIHYDKYRSMIHYNKYNYYLDSYCYNDPLQKYERNSMVSLISLILSPMSCIIPFFYPCRHRCSLARRCISILSIHNLSRSRATNVIRSNEREWSHRKKTRKPKLFHRNYYGCRLRRWSSVSRTYFCLSRIQAVLPRAGSKRLWPIYELNTLTVSPAENVNPYPHSKKECPGYNT